MNKRIKKKQRICSNIVNYNFEFIKMNAKIARKSKMSMMNIMFFCIMVKYRKRDSL